MEVIKPNEMEEFKPDEVVKKVTTRKEQFCSNLFFLEPQTQIPVHKHPDSEEIFYILDGEAIVTLGDEKEMVAAGSIIHSPKDVWHGVKNESGLRTKIMTVHGANCQFVKRGREVMVGDPKEEEKTKETSEGGCCEPVCGPDTCG